MRKAGILLPITSLPSQYGIGCFSKEAREFVDFLFESKNKLWQVLPQGPTSYGDSPYQSFSTFAGNPYFIDPVLLAEEGLLDREYIDSLDFGNNTSYIDYSRIYESRFPMLRKAFEAWCAKGGDETPDFRDFCRVNEYWLPDYALFMAIKDAEGGREWLLWDEGLRKREPGALSKARASYREDVLFYSFCQFYFYTQWYELKSYANAKGIEIVGDIPIYVAMDSADVWARPELYQLDEDCVPKAVAGVPPDYFSATGQLWGNPLYDWDAHKKTGYMWWIERTRMALRMHDIVRIDHFRGFEAYYSIPYGDETAQFGHWEKGPDYDLFRALKEAIGDELPIIAEDLGVITDDVKRLIDRCGFPGMKVLQFAFGAWDNEYLPHNHIRDSVVYTGTHDNDTLPGWLTCAGEGEKDHIRNYFGLSSDEDFAPAIIRAALASTADTVVVPIQDYMGLGREARINTPGVLGDNWKWRLPADYRRQELTDRIRYMINLYQR